MPAFDCCAVAVSCQLAIATAIIHSIYEKPFFFRERACVCVHAKRSHTDPLVALQLLYMPLDGQRKYMRYLCLNDSRINGCGNAVGSVLSFIIDSRAEPTCPYHCVYVWALFCANAARAHNINNWRIFDGSHRIFIIAISTIYINVLIAQSHRATARAFACLQKTVISLNVFKIDAHREIEFKIETLN